MKSQSLPNIISLTLSAVMVFVLAALNLSSASAQTGPTSTPQPTEEPAPQVVVTQAPAPVCDPNRSIQVSGTAVVNVTPDRVLIQLGVQSNGSSAAKVEAANSKTIQRVVNALKKLGVAQKDIVTDRYIIEPVYDDYNSLKIKGYRINNVVAITLSDLSKVNLVLTAALEAGANQVLNTEFYLSDLRTYRDQARTMAMTAAKEKAGDLARAAGSDIDCVLNINENTWSYFNGWGWYGGGGSSRDLWTQNAVQNAAPPAEAAGALSESGPISVGQISVRAEVSASFSLK
ncbi:MAG: SIMPL domain-containing protein [Anaerolineae bacterium]|nr:SIMPL domain-containing protein [Anaerolineae bacterium]